MAHEMSEQERTRLRLLAGMDQARTALDDICAGREQLTEDERTRLHKLANEIAELRAQVERALDELGPES